MKVNKNTALGKGLRTSVQAIAGAVVGLVFVVWAVPGVPEAVASCFSQLSEHKIKQLFIPISFVL